MFNIAQHGLRERDPRTTVFLPSRMRVNSSWTDACIHNVSARGMLVASDRAPDPGAYVEIRRGQAVIIGQAVWKKNQFFGVRTQDRIDLAVLQGQPARNGDAAGAKVERRSEDRFRKDAAIARTLERDRAFARLFQFGILAFAVAAASVMVASSVYGVLSAPVDRMTRAMAGAQ
jgi:hypothetical protein